MLTPMAGHTAEPGIGAGDVSSSPCLEESGRGTTAAWDSLWKDWKIIQLNLVVL